MAYVDEIYTGLIELVHKKGNWNTDKEVRAKYGDGTPAYAKEYFGHTVTFDKDHQPLVGVKETRYEKAVLELFWIHFLHSNKVEDLRKLGVSIWDEWEREDGTIGKAYGYVSGKKVRKIDGFDFTQLQYAMDRIAKGKNHRELVVSLWDLENLDDMALRPCVYQFQLYSDGHSLHMSVNQRSA